MAVLAQASQASPCGAPWAAAYASLHRRILKGEAPPRYLINIAATGLADRMLTLLTEFWWAVLSGRALQTLVYDHIPDFSTAFDAPCINWSVSEDAYPRQYWYHLKDVKKDNANYPASTFDPVLVQNINYQNDGEWLSALLSETNLRTGPPDVARVPYLFVSGNRGRTVHLWSSKIHGAELREMAPQYSAVAAAFNFLFTPNAATRALLDPWIAALQPAPGAPPVFWVAIHLRHNDREVFSPGGDHFDVDHGGGAANMHPHMSYFHCAEKVGKALASPGSVVRWLLISDSLSVRRSAKAKFGDRILTDVETRAIHVDCKQVYANTCNATRQANAMRLAARDLLLISHAHAHVLSENSGFGRLGAFLSAAPEPHIAFGMHGRRCELVSRTDHTLIYEWSGVRRRRR